MLPLDTALSFDILVGIFMPPIRLLILFFGSGACGLIYQIIWLRVGC